MRTFSKVLAVVLCFAMLFTTAFASGLKASFVDFEEANGKVTARVRLQNEDSENVLTGKIIVGAYDAGDNLINAADSGKYTFSKGKELVLSATTDSVEGGYYKAFVWNDAFNSGAPVHAVKGCTDSNSFVKDADSDNGLVSSKVVATDFYKDVTNGLLYSALRGTSGDDWSEESGARLASGHKANANQHHEIFYVDDSLKGCDYFAFAAGTIDYSTFDTDSLLEFDVVNDCEVIILTTNSALEFDGFELETSEEGYVKSRYLNNNYYQALAQLGVSRNYGLANLCTKNKLDEFYEEYLKDAYEAATDAKKTEFDNKWAAFGKDIQDACAMNIYAASYTAAYSADSENPTHVVIPKPSNSGTTTRNLLVVVKGVASEQVDSPFTPIIKAANADAAPALEGVTIDGEFVAVSEFNSGVLDYMVDATETNVLPVVKGITTDTALYTTTDYAIGADKSTATATVVVKNLKTGEKVSYTINMTLGVPESKQSNLVNMGSATLVDDTGVTVGGSYTPEIGGTSENPLGAFTCHIAGMTYAEYVDYVNEVTGGNYTATGSLGNKIIRNAHIGMAPEPFTVGGVLGRESGKRRVKSINGAFAFLEGLQRVYGSIELSYNTNESHGAESKLYYGIDNVINYTSGDVDYAIDAKPQADGLPAVPWFSVDINESCTVYVAAYRPLPCLVEHDYTLVSSDKEIYTGTDTNNTPDTSDDANVVGPKYLYKKRFEVKGNTPVKVDIYNENCHATTTHPASYFFKFGTDEELKFEYGKKSNAPVATAYNTSVTNGVLYTNLHGAPKDDPFQSGARWVSSTSPANADNVPYHRVISVNDPSIEGADYFAFGNTPRNYSALTSNLLEFNVDKDCEVLILTTDRDSAAVFEGFTKQTGDYISTLYPNAATALSIQAMGYPKHLLSLAVVEDFYKNGLTWTELYNKYLKDVFPNKTSEELRALYNTNYSANDEAAANADCFADATSKAGYGQNAGYTYTVAHVQKFKADSKVVIPVPTGKTTDFSRAIMVVVKPAIKGEEFIEHVTDFTEINTKGDCALGTTVNRSGIKNDYRLSLYEGGQYSSAPEGSSWFDSYAQRTYTGTDEVLGLENCIYLKHDNATLGIDAEWCGTGDYAGKDDVAWMSFKVNQDADIILVPKINCDPNFVTKEGTEWTKYVLERPAFTMTRRGTSTTTIPAVMYVKSVEAGDTVTLYNSNTGKIVGDGDNIPYHVFVRVK